MRVQIILIVVSVCACGFAVVSGAGPRRAVKEMPVVWSSPASIEFDIEAAGDFKAATQADIQNAAERVAAVWSGVPTSTIRMRFNSVRTIRIRTRADYEAVKQRPGRSLMVIDETGEITASIFGRRNTVAAFTETDPLDGAAIERFFIVINTRAVGANRRLEQVLVHEFGHGLGLDHSQINVDFEEDGILSNNRFVPRMFPRLAPVTGQLELHPDDVSAVSSLYPSGAFKEAFQAIRGTLRRDGTAEHVRGAIVIAVKVVEVGAGQTAESDYERYSCASGYLDDGTGNFEIWVPPGRYRLYADWQRFGHPSGVGPYRSRDDVRGQRVPGEHVVRIEKPTPVGDIRVR